GVNWFLLSAQIVNFAVLLFILQKYAYKPILRMLQQRQETIAKSLKQAEEIEEKLQKTEDDREKVLEKAAKEAQSMIDEVTQAANQIIADAHAKAAEDMEKILEQGRESIKLEREKM